MRYLKKAGFASISFLKSTGFLAMVIVYMALFYNAACKDKGEKSTDFLSGDIDWLVFSLTFFIGINQAVEIYDHAFTHDHHHDNHEQKQPETLMRAPLLRISELSVNEAPSPKPRLSLPQIVVCGAVSLILGAGACYALWSQTKNLVQNNMGISILFFIPSLCRFILLPGQHAKALVLGGEHELLQAVTLVGSENQAQFSAYKKTFLFLMYSLPHVADSQLLANQVEDQSFIQSLIYWACVIGLSCSTASYHVTHTLNVKTILKEFKKLSSAKKCVAGSLALTAGGLHASQSLLGLWHLLKLNQPLSILIIQGCSLGVEVLSGGMDALHHLCARMTQAMDAMHHLSLWHSHTSSENPSNSPRDGGNCRI